MPSAQDAAGILYGRGCEALFDDHFEEEAHIAEREGLTTDFVDLDEVLNGRAEDALSHLPAGRGRSWVYRGWLLDPEEYALLYEAILERGDQLVVTPHQLEEASCLPHWAPLLEGHTPASVWTEDDDADEAWDLALEELGPPPWIIKDHLKSARPLWHACFVPSGADRAAFAEVVAGLVDFRGSRFLGGIVVRRFVELATLPVVTENRPVPDEHRLVFWNGRVVAHAPYYDVDVEPVVPERFAWVGEVVDSPFFTADVARLRSGGWTIVELNDGGCSGLPDQLDPWELYRAIASSPP